MRTFTWSLVAAIALTSTGVTSALAGGAKEREGEPRANVILTEPPAASSMEYQYLRDIAGDLHGEALPMSRGEMWSLPESRFDQLMHAANEQGIKMMRVGEGFNTLFAAAPAEADTSEKTKKVMAETRQSAAVAAVTPINLKPPQMIEYALGRGEKPMLGNGRSTTSDSPNIVIPLNANQSIVAVRDYVETTREGCVWNGRVAGSELPVNLMWWPDGRMAGALSYNGKRYLIRNIEDDAHAIIEIDEAKLPPEHPTPPPEFLSGRRAGTAPPARSRGDRQQPPASELRNLEDARSGTTEIPDELADLIENEFGAQPETVTREEESSKETVISVLFAYTSNAARHYSNIRKDLLALAIEQTNQSFRASGVENVRVEIAASYKADYDESGGNLFNHLWRFVDRGDGHLEDIHRRRNEAEADIAILIVDSPTGCGLATRVAAEADEAFAAVHHDCATTSFSVAHEIGHLLGARHDRSLDTSTRPFPFGHGYVHQTAWRTMMSYKSSCEGCPRLPIWSSPDVKIKGQPAGDANTHNARVIAEQAARVARFR